MTVSAYLHVYYRCLLYKKWSLGPKVQSEFNERGAYFWKDIVYEVSSMVNIDFNVSSSV